MTTEHALVVGLEPTDAVLALVADLTSAAARARKAEPGERGDVVRLEALSAQLERLAAARAPAAAIAVELDGEGDERLLLGSDPSGWGADLPASVRDAARSVVAAGRVPVLLVTALEAGPTVVVDSTAAPAPPANRWPVSDLEGTKAVEARFRALVLEAVSAQVGADGASRPVLPSGVRNPVITDVLREYAARSPGHPTDVCVPVEYRDGSRSEHPLLLRSLELRDESRPADLELHLALLSIRHTEMDATVHGTWLRNAEISRPRPMAQTDDLVYEQSLRQFDELVRQAGTITIHLYQTGLEPAVVGFYKALIDHLARSPGSVAVQPMYYAARPNKGAKRGGRRRSGATSRSAVVADRAPFRKGELWAT